MNKNFFLYAVNEAKKAFNNNEVPIGAVIVKNGKIIAKAYNKKEKDNCCISHAEILAIKKASRKLNNWRLDGCDIYVTLDPCPMCASAIKQARIENVYSMLDNSNTNNIDIISKIFNSADINHIVNYYSNIDQNISKNLLQSFFERQRNK